MKRSVGIFIICIMLITASCLQVSAYTFPNSFWSMNSAFEAAVNSGDNAGIVQYGNQSIDLMLTQPECDEVINVLADRYQKVAIAYAKLGMYDESANAFEKLIPYAEKVGWADSVTIAKAKILQYRSDIRLYTDKGTPVYYGAKNEKQNGVLFGVCSNSDMRGELGNESLILLYHELGNSVDGYIRSIMQNAADNGTAVEYALNCPNEGYDIASIYSMEQNLSEISDLFREFSGVPVYLRFGAEFDVWTNPTDGNSYINAFRFVSDYFKSRNSNVAMVWSPNQVSAWNINIDDYYPGDNYVDWVGVSLYSLKYFQGNNAITDDFSEAVFKTGINADPVIALKNIVEKYGNRKPIIISESGQENYLYNGVNEDTAWWALEKMREFYLNLPMVYPQVKAAAYFDHYVSGEIHNFKISSNPTLKNEYMLLTKGQRFVQNGFSSDVGFCYREMYNGMTVNSVFPISAYAHVYNNTVKSVSYYIDGSYTDTSVKMPFTVYADASGLSNGTHSVKAVIATNGGKSIEKEFWVNVVNDGIDGISVKYSDENIAFDQPPVMYNDRTMVPARAIFEKLGASVSWDDATQTMTGVKDGKTVKVTIGTGNVTVNGEVISFDTPAIILSDRTLVPVRVIAECLNCSVNWDDTSKTVVIE